MYEEDFILLLKAKAPDLLPAFREFQANLTIDQASLEKAVLREKPLDYAAQTATRNNNEERLYQKDQSYKALLENATDIIIRIDRDLRYYYANPAVFRTGGFHPESLIGKTPAEIGIPAANVAFLQQMVDRVYLSKEEQTFTYEYAIPGQSVQYYQARLIPEFDTDNEVKTVLGITREITDLKQAEAALAAEKERLSVTLSSIADAVMATDLSGRVTLMNHAAEYLTGWSMAEAIGEPLSAILKLVEPEFNNSSEKMPLDVIRQVLEKEQTIHYQQPLKLLVNELGWRMVSLNASPIRAANQQVIGVVVALRDETEKQKVADELFKSSKLASVGLLAGGIAHDFNNLLTVILGYTELMLLELDETNPFYENLNDIKKESERAARLIRQLLAFSRRQVMHPTTLNFNELILSTEKLLRRTIGEEIELVEHLDPQLGNVRADRAQMEQVIMNLVVNARDAIRNGGKITLETRNIKLTEKYVSDHSTILPGNYVFLAVSDTGSGISAEIRSKIFEPFFTTKLVDKGTGLGLSTVYGIIKQSEGSIEVYSEVNQGSTFKIYLPQVSEEASLPKPAVSISPVVMGHETILLIDDDTGVRRLTFQILQQAGFRVLVATRPNEALEISTKYQGKIHLVLSDFVMPEMNGLKMVKELRKQRPEFKVLFMSGYTQGALESQIALEFQDNLLPKPFNRDMLLRGVREVLDKTD